MGDGDLVASTTRIAQCAQALTRIHDEFAHHGNPADGYGRTELGSDLLVDMFHDFGSNWTVHRRKLTDELERLAKITDEAAKTFDRIDMDLAQALTATDKADAKDRT
ncbi:hypothetical protein [Streptomyces sp.]|uniref:hypothetical protein n=1 Tax=Streptomyces sp. TaxID=1931 RepID=UPI002F427872